MVRRALYYLPTLMFFLCTGFHPRSIIEFCKLLRLGRTFSDATHYHSTPLGKVHTTAVGPTWNRQSHRGSVVPHRNPVYAREGL